MKKILTLTTLVLTLFALSASLGYAANVTMTKPPIIPTGITPATLNLPGVGNENPEALQQTVLPGFTTLVIGLTGGLSLLFVIISGIQILTAYGQEEKITEAKKTLTWALVGLLISILSYAIVQIIISIKFT